MMTIVEIEKLFDEAEKNKNSYGTVIYYDGIEIEMLVVGGKFYMKFEFDTDNKFCMIFNNKKSIEGFMSMIQHTMHGFEVTTI